METMKNRAELETLANDPHWRNKQIRKWLGGPLFFLPCWLKPFQNPRWENPEEMKRLFCLEFMDGEQPQRSVSGRLAVSEHFILVRSGITKKLYYSPYFRNLEWTSKGFTYFFKDLTRFTLSHSTEEDRDLLKKAIQKHGLTVRARSLGI